MENGEVTAGSLAAEYIKLRDAKKKLDKIYDQKKEVIEQQMQAITNQLNELCEKLNASSIRTDHGTIIRSVSTDYHTTDWDSMHKVVLEYSAPYLLWKRINNSAMKEFLDAHPDVFPPGLRIDSKYTVSVRKPTKTKGEYHD